uniref:Reticulon-like protein B13 n=1 Tax=Tanacetum cinerariifolium TaxID=118510 RepID=A0A6L2JF12_TANCI|nr:reticulon-like protein B13 [Tanacetum cinerariifolium]
MCEPSASSCMRRKRSSQRNRPGSQMQPESNARNVTRRVGSVNGKKAEGTVVGMIPPMVWHKYDYKIREYEKRLEKQSNGFYTMIDARAVQKIKNKLNVNSPRLKIKEKKAE